MANARVVVDGGQIPGTFADSAGRFELALRPGQHVLRVDRLGYAPLDVGVMGMGGVELVVQLAPLAAPLDSVRVVARPVSPRMQAFEAHRQLFGANGRFFTRDELRSYGLHVSLADLLRRVPGAQIVHPDGAPGNYLATGRLLAPYAMTRAAGACYAQVFLDGVQVFGPATRRNVPPPNLDEFTVDALEAVEFYGIPGSTPPEFRTLTANCGTLVLWSRDGP